MTASNKPLDSAGSAMPTMYPNFFERSSGQILQSVRVRLVESDKYEILRKFIRSLHNRQGFQLTITEDASQAYRIRDQNKRTASVVAQREQTAQLGNKYRNLGVVELSFVQSRLAFYLNQEIRATIPLISEGSVQEVFTNRSHPCAPVRFTFTDRHKAIIASAAGLVASKVFQSLLLTQHRFIRNIAKRNCSFDIGDSIERRNISKRIDDKI